MKVTTWKKLMLMVMGLVLSWQVWAEVQIGHKVPALNLMDIEGKQHDWKQYQGKIVVLEWLNYDCPFVKKHYEGQNMQQLQKTYTDKGVVWLSIISSAPGKQGNYAAAEIAKMNKERDAHPTAILLDSEGIVGHAFGAQTTPHMFIVNKKGKLAYQGAIDDRPTYEKGDVQGAKNYVALALEQLLQNKKVETAKTKPYGCGVKYK